MFQTILDRIWGAYFQHVERLGAGVGMCSCFTETELLSWRHYVNMGHAAHVIAPLQLPFLSLLDSLVTLLWESKFLVTTSLFSAGRGCHLNVNGQWPSSFGTDMISVLCLIWGSELMVTPASSLLTITFSPSIHATTCSLNTI